MGNIDYTKNPLVKKFIEVETNENKVKNIFLYAGGGYGKTTAMCCLFKYLLDKASNGEKIVPIYIDVKKLNFNETNPIISYIHSKYSGSDTKESDVKNLFSDQSPEFSKKYTYYILIDGLNETNDGNKGNLIDIISYMTQISNIRFVVSSRIKETFDKAPFCTFELQKLNEEQIKDYLDKNFGKKYNEQTKVKGINKSLIEILQIPMFMKVFSKTYDKRSPYPDIYDEKTVRKADILDSYVQKILLNLKERTNSYDNHALKFVINFYLPALAFQMAEKNVLELDSEIVDEKLDLEYFATFFKGTRKKKIEALIKNDGFMPECICSENFALINDNDGDYSFVHQIWRDFFAAKHIINCMNAERLDELEISVDENTRQFVGELIREYVDTYKYSKKPAYKSIYVNGKVKFIDNPDTRKCECDFEEKDNLEDWSESPIEHFMQQHNMNSINPISPIVTRNLIETMKTSRNKFIVACYSGLDLTECNMISCCCCNSQFDFSKISKSTFFHFRDDSVVEYLSFSTDGEYIAVSCHSHIELYNYNTDELTLFKGDTLSFSHKSIIYFSLNGKWLVKKQVGSNYCELWNTINGKYYNEIYNCKKLYTNTECFSDGKSYITFEGHIIKYYVNGLLLQVIYDDYPITAIKCTDKYFISANYNGIIKVFNINFEGISEQPVKKIFLNCYVVAFALQPNGRVLASAHANGDINFWDFLDFSLIKTYSAKGLRFRTYEYYGLSNEIKLWFNDGTVRTWNINLQQLEDIKYFDKNENLYFSTNNNQLVGKKDAIVKMYDLNSNKIKYYIDMSIYIDIHNYFLSLEYSPLGEYLIVCCENLDNFVVEKIHVFLTENGEYVKTINGKAGSINNNLFYMAGMWKRKEGDKLIDFNCEEKDIKCIFDLDHRYSRILSYHNVEKFLVKYILSSNIINCRFFNINYQETNSINDFYKIIYLNGAIVPEEYEPKPILYKLKFEDFLISDESE